MTYHPTIQTNIHDVVGIHIRAKGRVFGAEQMPAPFDTTETTDITITCGTGQELKITVFHERNVVPTYSSVEQEKAEVTS